MIEPRPSRATHLAPEPIEPELVGIDAEFRAIEQVQPRGTAVGQTLQRRKRVQRVPQPITIGGHSQIQPIQWAASKV